MSENYNKEWNNDAIGVKFHEVDHRLDGHDKKIDNLSDLVAEIKVMNEQQKEMNTKIDTLTTKVDKLEQEPLDNFKHRHNVVVDALLGILVTLIAGIIIYIIIITIQGG